MTVITARGDIRYGARRSKDPALPHDETHTGKGNAMSTETRMQPDTFEQLRSALEDTLWSHDSLAEYVTELSQQRSEEDIFRRLAFRSADCGGAGALSAGAFSGLYAAMSAENKTKLRRWWHEMIRREAYHYDDLGSRLSWRYLV